MTANKMTILGGENMNQNDKYLWVTLRDRDFWYPLEAIGKLLYDIFYYMDYTLTEDDLPMLREHVKHLLHRTYCVEKLLDKEKGVRRPDVDVKYFNPRIEFVEYSDIPDWDNGESIYIPIFDNGEIITR